MEVCGTSKQHRGKRSKQSIQQREAKYIQHNWGLYHDREISETVNLMTPAEIIYYLTITFEGVEMNAVPETAIDGLVLEQNLTYQINNS